MRLGEKIQIQTEHRIKTEDYPGRFKYLIYDGYRPQNLQQTRDYLRLLTNSEAIEDNLNENTPKHIADYCN